MKATLELTWEQKLAAILAFAGDASLKMRGPGDWYVSCGMSIGGDGCLLGSYGNGASPQEAVEDHWRIYSTLPLDKYAHAGRFDEDRRGRWNGFMWEGVAEDEANRIREANCK